MSDRTREVRISVRANGTVEEVLVDGQDVTRLVQGLDVTAYAGEAPQVTLRLVPEAVTLDLDGAELESLLSMGVDLMSPDDFDRALDDPTFREQLEAEAEEIRRQLEMAEQEEEAPDD